MPKRKVQPDAEEATRIIAAIIARRSDEVSISPTWVATEALAQLGVKSMLTQKGAGPIVYQLAHLQCRQIARQLLGKSYDPTRDAVKAQHSLWTDVQDRYPAAPSPDREEPEYVRLEHLTVADWQFNVHRMQADVRSRSAHLDAFKSWGRQRFGAAAATLAVDVQPPVTH